jgi:hypothetical protein
MCKNENNNNNNKEDQLNFKTFNINGTANKIPVANKTVSSKEKLIYQALKQLHSNGYTTLKSFDDSIGTYSYLLLAPDGTRVYLVAKNSEVIANLLSCHYSIVKEADSKGAKIMLAYKTEAQIEIKYYLFEPENILLKNVGVNKRFDAEMINFDFNLAIPFNPERQSIYIVTQQQKTGNHQNEAN